MLQIIKARIFVFLKGMAMGAADVVPGVSGGTMAFITNIYEKLIESLNNIDLTAIKLLFTGKIKSLIDRINGFFLLTLLVGVLSAVLTLAKLVEYLLEHHPIFVWSFFMGLIMASAWIVGRRIKEWNYSILFWVILGGLTAYFITEFGIIEMPDTGFYIFIAGVISIIAMILPGISGSFLLVIMNKYELIISAMSSISELIKSGIPALFKGDWNALQSAYSNADVLLLIFFYTGTLTGLLTFAKILNWLFRKFHDITIAVLTGFLIGSLNKVWPWKITVSYYEDRHGEMKPLDQNNVLPQSFDADVFYSIGLIAVGFLIVFLIDRVSTIKIME